MGKCQAWKDSHLGQPRRPPWDFLTEALIDVGTDSMTTAIRQPAGKDARCCFDGKGTIAQLKPIMSTLMCKMSAEAVVDHNPKARPYIVCRSGSAGIQKYAQTWCGDFTRKLVDPALDHVSPHGPVRPAQRGRGHRRLLRPRPRGGCSSAGWRQFQGSSNNGFKTSLLAGWTYWVVHMPYIASKASGGLKAVKLGSSKIHLFMILWILD